MQHICRKTTIWWCNFAFYITTF